MRWERLVKLLWVKKYINKCLASNRMGVLGILQECSRSCRSVRDRIKVYKISKTQSFIPAIPFFNQKKIVKKGYCRNEVLGFTWNRVEVYQVAPYISTSNTKKGTGHTFGDCKISSKVWDLYQRINYTTKGDADEFRR